MERGWGTWRRGGAPAGSPPLQVGASADVVFVTVLDPAQPAGLWLSLAGPQGIWGGWHPPRSLLWGAVHQNSREAHAHTSSVSVLCARNTNHEPGLAGFLGRRVIKAPCPGGLGGQGHWEGGSPPPCPRLAWPTGHLPPGPSPRLLSPSHPLLCSPLSEDPLLWNAAGPHTPWMRPSLAPPIWDQGQSLLLCRPRGPSLPDATPSLRLLPWTGVTTGHS